MLQGDQTVSRMHNPPHPGGILREELEELEVTPEDFASRIGVKPEELLAVLDEKAPVTKELAEKIARTIQGPTAATWRAMQVDFDAWQAAHAARDESSD